MTVQGIAAGVWEGGQLSDEEAFRLCSFARQLAAQNAPVLALLDFPRRDSIDRALSLGAAVVMAKPWVNRDVVETLEGIVQPKFVKRAA